MQAMKADGRSVNLPERQPLQPIARTITALNVAMMLLGLSLVVASFVANGGTVRVPTNIYIRFFVARFFVALGFSFLALLILKRRPRHTVGWLTMVVGFFASLQFLIDGYI